jgi:hypothetical protein
LDLELQLIERWGDLVKIHTRRVNAICHRFLSSEPDLTLEVFLWVFRPLKSFRAGDGSFMIWLGRPAHTSDRPLPAQFSIIERTHATSAWTRGHAGRARGQRDASARAQEAVARVARNDHPARPNARSWRELSIRLGTRLEVRVEAEE